MTSKLHNFLSKVFPIGFRIPFEGTLPKLTNHNFPSIHEQPEIASNKIQEEIDKGRIAGPFDERPLANFVVSPICLVPKKTPGKFRIIHHLSYPHGSSINEGISKYFTPVKYHTVDNALQVICQLGRGCLLAKTDVESAFRLIPVHHKDYHLLGFTFKGRYYYDKMLAMGLSTSCKVFEYLSTAIQWIATSKGEIENMVHIVDDFLILASSKANCANQLRTFQIICEKIGVSLAPEKTEGPSQCIKFAGIELGTVLMEARLPQEKLEK